MLRRGFIVVGVFLVALLPFGIDSFYLNLLVLAAIYIPLALGLSVLFGYTNLVSFGQGGFFAIGSYTSALLTLKSGFSVWLAIVISIAASAVVGYLIGRPVLRLKGLSLAMATLALGLMIFILVQQSELTGGPIGLSGIPAPEALGIDFTEPRNYYWMALAIAVLVFLLTRNLATSRFGRMFRALGVSEPAALAVGVNVDAAKAVAFTYAAALAGLSGALYAHYYSFISSDTFGLDLSILVVIMVVVGGLRSLWGAVIGALLIIFLREYLRSYQEYSELVYGLLLIIAFMGAPGGIVGLVNSLRQRLHRRRPGEPLQDPSLRTERVTS